MLCTYQRIAKMQEKELKVKINKLMESEEHGSLTTRRYSLYNRLY